MDESTFKLICEIMDTAGSVPELTSNNPYWMTEADNALTKIYQLCEETLDREREYG